MQHRHEDRHAVYVDGNRADNDAKHRHEDGHAVYVRNENTLKKWVDVIYTTTTNECDTENTKEKSGEFNSKRCGVNNLT